MISFLIGITIWLTGALVVWRFTAKKDRTRYYEAVEQCYACMSASKKYGYMQLCYLHSKRLKKMRQRSIYTSFQWPGYICMIMAKYMGLLIIHIASFLRWILSKIMFPNGITTDPERRIMENIKKAVEQRQEEELRQKLRSMGIDDMEWMPSVGDVESCSSDSHRWEMPVAPRSLRAELDSYETTLEHSSATQIRGILIRDAAASINTELQLEIERNPAGGRDYGPLLLPSKKVIITWE